MYNDFSIKSVYTVFSENAIVIETNFSINENTVNQKTVRLIKTSDQSVEFYKLKVEENKIFIKIDRTLEKDETFILIINNVEDKLERKLSSTFNKTIKFEPALKKILNVTAPSNNETIRSRTVDIDLKVMSETNEDTNYRIEVSKDITFFNIENTIKTKDLFTTITVKEDGQYYVRARAELEENENSFGLWSKEISFFIVTKENLSDCVDDSLLDDYVFSDELFVDDVIPLELVYRTPDITVEDRFMIEINKNVKFKEPRFDEVDPGFTNNNDADIDPGFTNDNYYIDNGEFMVRPAKVYQIKNKKKRYIKSYIIVYKNTPNIIEVSRIDKMPFEEDSIYEITLPEILLEDNTTLKLDTIEYITSSEKYLIDIEDVKVMLHDMDISNKCIIDHILAASDIAIYWSKKHDKENIMDITKDNIKNDYYPFYMFIKYKALHDIVLEYYMTIASKPIKIKDAVSDLSREEEYDLKYLKELLDEFEQEADDWLDFIVTTTADPQYSVRGKYAYAIDIKGSRPYHKYQYGLTRGGYEPPRGGFPY